jgi:hypothetical protein
VAPLLIGVALMCGAALLFALGHARLTKYERLDREAREM